MQEDSSILFIAILLFLLIIQVFALFVIKKLLKGMAVLVSELKNTRKKITYQHLTKEIIASNTYKTCQNCVFRQSFIEADNTQQDMFFYRCRLTQTGVQLNDSCVNFQLESSTSNSK